MRSFIFVVLSVVFTVFEAGAAEPSAATAPAMDLPALVKLAEQQQIDWYSSRVASEAARLESVSGRSSLLPDLRLESAYGHDYQTSARGQESNSSSAALRSRWSLYDNGVSWTNYQIDRERVELARMRETLSREEVVLGILNRYSAAWIARRHKEITSQRLALLQAQHSITERQFRQGLKARGDYQRLQSELQRAKLALERQTNEELGRLDELSRYIGRVQPLTWTELPRFPANELLTRWSLPTTPDPDAALTVKIAARELAISEQQAQLTRRQLWPELSMSLSAAYGSDDFAGSGQSWGDQERWSADGRLELDWTLWDWQDRRSQHQKSELATHLSEQRREQARIDHRTALARLERDRQRLKESVRLVREIYQIELKTFRDIEVEYREGKTGYLDLISSLDRRTQAELDLEEESSLATLNAAEILHLFGELYAHSVQP